jgi:predicted secreted hydrolase
MPNSLIYGSYYSSSFLTDTKGGQYTVLSHFNTETNTSAFFRGSLLDMTTSTYTPFFNHTPYSVVPSPTFNVSANEGGFQSTSQDNVSIIRTWSTNANVQYDLTFEATSAILYDVGAGQYQWATGLTNEWGMPACKTTGTLQVNGSTVTIDPSRSLTWYDRQWGPGFIEGNWTWFELHLGPSGSTKVSVSAWDSLDPVGEVRFATVRAPNGDHSVLSVTVIPSYKRSYTSSTSNVTYPLDWEIISPIGETLFISSFKADQEIVGSVISEYAYEGFASTRGAFMGTVGDGFGVVEMVRTF